jgi:hypothetical protein
VKSNADRLARRNDRRDHRGEAVRLVHQGGIGQPAFVILHREVIRGSPGLCGEQVPDGCLGAADRVKRVKRDVGSIPIDRDVGCCNPRDACRGLAVDVPRPGPGAFGIVHSDSAHRFGRVGHLRNSQHRISAWSRAGINVAAIP